MVVLKSSHDRFCPNQSFQKARATITVSDGPCSWTPPPSPPPEILWKPEKIRQVIARLSSTSIGGHEHSRRAHAPSTCADYLRRARAERPCRAPAPPSTSAERRATRLTCAARGMLPPQDERRTTSVHVRSAQLTWHAATRTERASERGGQRAKEREPTNKSRKK